MIEETRKVVFTEKGKGNFISYKDIDFSKVHDYKFRNTTEFI